MTVVTIVEMLVPITVVAIQVILLVVVISASP